MNFIEILLVEDNEGDILLTTEALNDSEIATNISVVKDGLEALNYLQKKDKYSNARSPQLVLLDINLPKVNGFEVLREIKSSEDLKHIPVVILSTSSSEEDIHKCYSNYATCFITKPLSADSFSEVISSVQNFFNSVVQLPKTV
ncbi:response regulator [Antarcticibacterium flavum]|uniref:Response regulator n=2 Tax=Antarcticibacterium flavum TaxID=2058175 RepID=A0A5B7X7G2_9FLAO|nr:response regulator [Antarcticibacterium sp. W02-3]MCM4158748.1 response regulator [Antarcticibacterium sp. W02-3]QCY71349.1 response regulator [Antarcticibacterium flavum]